MTTSVRRALSVIDGAMRPTALRAVAYLRVSTEEQKKGYGITYTKKKVLAHIEKKGWSLADVYADEGFSGSLDHTERPDLRRLMEDARTTPRRFDVVCVNEERAIGRAGRAFWPWVWELEDLGVFVAIVKGDYDNTTPDGRSRMRKAADRAEDERETIRERTQSGIQEKAEAGLYPGGMVPYGYRIEDQGKLGLSRYALDECGCAGECISVHETLVLRRARRTFIARRNWREVAEDLNADGWHDRAGNPWTERKISKRLLCRAVREACVIWRGDDAARLPDGTPVYGEEVVIPLPPVFAPEELDELDRARRTPRASGLAKRIYPLSGRLISLCGAAREGRRENEESTVYVCKARDTCECRPVSAPQTEERVWGAVAELLSDGSRMQAMAQDWLAAHEEDRVDYSARIAELDERIADQQEIITVTTATTARQAVRRGLRGQQAEQAVDEAVRPLSEELAGLERLRAEAVSWQNEAAQASRRMQDLDRLAKLARQRLGAIGLEEQHELMGLLDLTATLLDEPVTVLGQPCALRKWFTAHGKAVPLLTDEGWERVRPLLEARARRSRRPIAEAMLAKARTGGPWADLSEYGTAGALRTQASLWVRSGVWGQAMDLLADFPSVPVWSPPAPRIQVTLRPLGLGTIIDLRPIDPTDRGRESILELTFTLTA